MRRLRNRLLQPMLTEQHLTPDTLIAPLFVDETATAPVPIPSMPGQFRYPLSDIAGVAENLAHLGIRAVLLFGIPKNKDKDASSAFSPQGVIQKAVRSIKEKVPSMVVITDVCACEYTDHGHCGIICDTPLGPDLNNDLSLALMERIALSHADAGADVIAPSCMLDGMVYAIRGALDETGFSHIPIMAYSAKFASALYGPFRDAAGSGFSFGDRTTYQMNPANGREAARELDLDDLEGADILMVKPAGWYGDVIREAATHSLPVAAYQVSGEYAMIKAASANGWLDEKKVVLESLMSLQRAGASLIITYFAADAVRWLCEQ